MREQTLPEVPSLGSLYSQAVARTARLAMSRGVGDGRLPEVEYVVHGVQGEAAGLSAYQELLGEPGTDELPAGYVHVLAFPLAMAVMVRPDFPLPVLGMVHVANRVVQHRPLLLGEELTVRAQAQDPRAHRRGTTVDLAVTVSAGAEVVWEGTSIYLAKGRTLPGTAEAPAGGTSSGGASSGGAPSGGTPSGGAPSGGTRSGGTPSGGTPSGGTPSGGASSGGTSAAANDDGHGGDVVAVWSLPADTGKRYAEVSGDRNPIHVSRLGARAFGFPRPIAHGMYTASRALAQLARFRGDTFTWEVEFAKPVLLPGRVALAVDHTGESVRYAGRHPRSGKVHLTGAVTPHRGGISRERE